LYDSLPALNNLTYPNSMIQQQHGGLMNNMECQIHTIKLTQL